MVKYTADEANGFQAEVIRNGISSLHGQLKNENNFAQQNPKIIRNNNKYYSKAEKDDQQQQQHLYNLPKWEQHQPKYTQQPALSQYNRPKIEQQQHYPQPLLTSHYNRPKVEKWPSSGQYNAAQTPSSSLQYNPSNYNQWQQVSNQQRPHNTVKQYPQTPSTTVRNYGDYNHNNYNKNNIDNGSDNDNDNENEEDDDADANEEDQPHYEVHEKPNQDNDDDDDESEQVEDDQEDNEDVGGNEKYQEQQQQQQQHYSQYNPHKWQQHYSPPSTSSLYNPSIYEQQQQHQHYPQLQYNPPKLVQWQQLNHQQPYVLTTPAPLIIFNNYNVNNNTDDDTNIADEKANIDGVDTTTSNANGYYNGLSEEPQTHTEVNKPNKDVVVHVITNKKKKKPNSKKGNRNDNDDEDDDDDDDDDYDDSSEEDYDDDSEEFEEYNESVRKPHINKYY